MPTPKVSERYVVLLMDATLRNKNLHPPLRIFDMGCGNGRLLAYLAQKVARRHPDLNFELYGFEVCDIGWRVSEHHGQTVAIIVRTLRAMRSARGAW